MITDHDPLVHCRRNVFRFRVLVRSVGLICLIHVLCRNHALSINRYRSTLYLRLQMPSFFSYQCSSAECHYHLLRSPSSSTRRSLLFRSILSLQSWTLPQAALLSGLHNGNKTVVFQFIVVLLQLHCIRKVASNVYHRPVTGQKNSVPPESSESPPRFASLGQSRPKCPEHCCSLTCACAPNLVWIG